MEKYRMAISELMDIPLKRPLKIKVTLMKCRDLFFISQSRSQNVGIHFSKHDHGQTLKKFSVKTANIHL